MPEVRYLVVAIAGFVLGGWAVPLGFVLGIGPLGTFVAAASGGLVGCWAFILVGDRISEWARRRRNRPDEEPAPGENGADGSGQDVDDAGRVRRFVDRYGVRGLGLVGPIFPGVTASVVGGLALGLERRELGKWMTIGIIVMYGLYSVGLWILVELF
jgi:hypothetical protein